MTMIDTRFRNFVRQCIDSPDVARELLMNEQSNPLYIKDKRILLDLITSGTKHMTEVTPVQYLSVRNVIVEALYYRQGYIDDIITRFRDGGSEFRKSNQGKLLRRFFRLWLDVALKLCNVPSRIQVSTNLELPVVRRTFDTRTVAKLVYNVRGSLSRMFMMDKTAKTNGTMPVSVPLGRVLTYYMSSYILYVMPKGSKYVFNDTKNDVGKWNPESQEFVDFLCQRPPEGLLGLPGWLLPRQHCLRIIGINAMAALYHFDSGRLEDLGTLSRHTRNVMLTDYTFWSDLHQERFQNLEDTGLLYLRIDDEMDVNEELESGVMDSMDSLYLTELMEPQDVRDVPDSVPVNRIDGSSVCKPIVIHIGDGTPRPMCSLCGQMVIFQKYHKKDDEIEFLLSCVEDHDDEDKEWFYWKTDQLSFDRMINSDGYYTYPPNSSSKSDRVRGQTRSKIKKLDWYVRNGTFNPIVQRTCYVGLDISPKVLAFSIKTFKSTKIVYHSRTDTGPEIDEYNGLEIKRVFHDESIDENDMISKFIESMVDSIESCGSDMGVCISYETALAPNPKISAKQRELVLSIDHILRHKVRDVVGNQRFRILDIDNMLVKSAWERTFHGESGVDQNSEYKPLLENMNSYISLNQARRMGSVKNLSAKLARKAKNYVIWCSKNLPVFAGTVLSESVSTLIKNFGSHPVSDIVDAYMLSRHMYYVDAYTGTVPYGEPFYVDYNRWLDDKSWEQVRAHVAEITRETRMNYQEGDRILIDGIDTGITMLGSNGNNDKHDLEVEFTFITRNESSNEKNRRLRSEFRTWRNISNLEISE